MITFFSITVARYEEDVIIQLSLVRKMAPLPFKAIISCLVYLSRIYLYQIISITCIRHESIKIVKITHHQKNNGYIHCILKCK